MGNPRPDLQGFADPSQEGWRERALERVHARQAANRQHSLRRSGLYLFFDDPFRAFLDEAATQRDISLTGYLRRAAAAMIAHDLGIPFEEVAQHAAQPTRYGNPGGTAAKKRTHDNGQGHGLWRIKGLGK